MADMNKVLMALECWGKRTPCKYEECPYHANTINVLPCQEAFCLDAIELLKEHDEQKRKWLRNIADNQLANAPTETMNESKQIYYRGIWYGLQMAYDILTEET